MSDRPQSRTSLFASAAVGVLSWHVYEAFGPVMVGPEVNPVAAAALGLVGLSGLGFAAEALNKVGGFLEWFETIIPTGLKGTAGLIEKLSEFEGDILKNGWGPYFGAFKGHELIAPYESTALTVGTTGSSKSSGIAVPTILAIPDSKCITDFKGSLTCQTIEELRRRGENVRVLNYAQAHTDILGFGDTYNPMSILTDCFKRPGGLLEFGEINSEKALQLYPEPAGKSGGTDNTYFRDESRFIVEWVNQTICLIQGDAATLGEAYLLLNDRHSMLTHAQWACGRLPKKNKAVKIQTDSLLIDKFFNSEIEEFEKMPLEDSPWVTSSIHSADDIENFITQYRSDSERVVELLTDNDSRNTGPFLTGARQGMRRFRIATRAHKISSSSSFRFADMKSGDKPTTVFIIADANAIAAQGPLIAHIQWCMMQELKRHKDKHRPVYWIADEAANFKLHELGSLLTWARGYGVRIHLFLQNFSAFREAYSQETLKTVLSEAEIQQFLPNTREQEVLDYVEKKLGQKTVIVRSRRRSNKGHRIEGIDYREEARPVLTADEVRREERAILFVKNHKGARVDIIPFSAINPWRDVVGIDPHHGKKWTLKIKLRLSRAYPSNKPSYFNERTNA